MLFSSSAVEKKLESPWLVALIPYGEFFAELSFRFFRIVIFEASLAYHTSVVKVFNIHKGLALGVLRRPEVTRNGCIHSCFFFGTCQFLSFRGNCTTARCSDHLSRRTARGRNTVFRNHGRRSQAAQNAGETKRALQHGLLIR